jgi:ISXO2-like transposase domain
LLPHVDAHVERGATVYTDALDSYAALKAGFDHEVVDHAEAYVDGHVHTNGMESHWALLKRALGGTYIAVEPCHLFRDHDSRRYGSTSAKATDAERVVGVLANVVGSDLTYERLIGAPTAQRARVGCHGAPRRRGPKKRSAA